MSAKAHKAIIHTLADAFNTRHLDDFVSYFSPDFMLYTATTPDWPRGLDGARQMATAMLAAAPDMHITIEDFVAEDDRVAVRWTFRGTPASE